MLYRRQTIRSTAYGYSFYKNPKQCCFMPAVPYIPLMPVLAGQDMR
jgi:hypothetical protein